MNSTTNHCAKIAIYRSYDQERFIDLYWNERTDSAIIKEDGISTTILVKPDATLMDAVCALGYNHEMVLDLYEPHLTSHRDRTEHLQRILLTCEGTRIILSRKGYTYAGKPAMVGW